MDWLNRARQFVGNLFGGAQRTIGQISGGVARAVGQAEQQAARTAQQVVRQIPQPPRIQLPQVPQVQMPRFQAPQAPRIDFGAVARALQGFQQGLDISGRTFTGKALTPEQQRLVAQIPGGKTMLAATPRASEIGQFLRSTAPGIDLGLSIKEKGLGAFSAQERMQRGLIPAIQQQTTRSLQRLMSTPEGQQLQRMPGLQGQIGQAAQMAAFNPEQAIKSTLQTGVNIVGEIPGIKQISQTKAGKIANEYLINPTVNSLITNLSRIGGAQTGQKTYAKGLQGEMQNLSDIINIGSLIYSGNLSTQLASKTTPFFQTAAKLAPRLFASGTGQDLITQLAEGKKPNELDWKRALMAGGAYTTFGIGIPGVTRGGSTAFSKLFGTSAATKIAQTLPKDKNALVIASSLPEKGALRAQGYTNVKVQFQPKPGQVAPTMQGAIPEVAPKAPQVGKTDPLEALKAEADRLKEVFRKTQNGEDLRAWRRAQNGVEKAEELQRITKESKRIEAQKKADIELRKTSPDIDKLSSDNFDELRAEAKKHRTLGEFLSKVRGSSTQYGEYTPKLRKYVQPTSVAVGDIDGLNPNTVITVYRGIDSKSVAGKGIKRGDFVTTDYNDALQYTDSPSKVVSTRAKLKDLISEYPEEVDITNPKSPVSYELLYNPGAKVNKVTDTQLTEIYNQANKPTLPVKPIYETAPKPAVTFKGVEAPKSSVQTVIDALAEAKPIRGKQEALYAAERAKRVAKVAAMGEKVQGEKGFFAQLGQLKGELPKAQFEGIRKQITQPVVDDLFNQIEKSNISVFEKVTAKQGLAKLLGAEGGIVPTRGELSLLNEVFPKELTQAILAKRTVMQKLGSIGGEIINLPRSIMSTVDLSAPFRQGIFMIGRPKQFIPAVGQMIKYAGSEKAYQGLQAQLRSRPTYQLMRQSKLALTDIDAPLLGREEAFMSNLAEKIPGFGILARGSDRAYTGFLNKLRADVFDDLLTKAKTTGAINDNPQIADDIANFVNAATGRGKLPNALEKSAVALNGIFFSPRLMASRLNLLNPVYYVKLDPFVRKEALKSLFTFAATGASVLGLAKAGGADVGVDPRSSDFGKIKIGNTRYDPWGGFQQYMVLASRLISGEMISSTTGKQMKLGESFKDPTRLDIIQRFLESKQAPIASFVTGFLKGKTTTGENFNLPVEIADRFMPMMTQDMYDLYKEYGPKGIAMGIPGIFGFGSQTYQDQIPVKTKTKSGKETTTWRQAPSLGEEILNKLTGKQITNVPQEQIPSLQEARKKEIQYGIDLDKVKAEVLASGETKTIHNPVRNVDIQVYLKNGIVTTKDIKAPIAKKPKVKVSKARRTGGRGRVARAKVTIPKAPRLKAIKVAVPKAPKVSFKQPTPTKARKSIKIKA